MDVEHCFAEGGVDGVVDAGLGRCLGHAVDGVVGGLDGVADCVGCDLESLGAGERSAREEEGGEEGVAGDFAEDASGLVVLGRVRVGWVVVVGICLGGVGV